MNCAVVTPLGRLTTVIVLMVPTGWAGAGSAERAVEEAAAAPLV